MWKRYVLRFHLALVPLIFECKKVRFRCSVQTHISANLKVGPILVYSFLGLSKLPSMFCKLLPKTFHARITDHEGRTVRLSPNRKSQIRKTLAGNPKTPKQRNYPTSKISPISRVMKMFAKLFNTSNPQTCFLKTYRWVC